ncbi:hypothetical protein H2198_000892 [Neophaeococcomyces mojaviensis]|uniref:Uncharacterized protein n=1 Tax=Neophaeococcomyces mojaviensis TaxID=3383035 RepID=A0ACC3AIQ4_9EURO|nr:hypothetical protein H2198_000892 [Knufia sp. JES_112]
MGYNQWLQLQLVNRTDRDLTIVNLHLQWGKLYIYSDKDRDLPETAVNNHTIHPGQTFSFAACGRKGAASGTEGEFSLRENGGKDIMKVYWDCPYSGKNKFSTYYVSEGYFPSTSNWSTGEALGTVTVTIFHS